MNDWRFASASRTRIISKHRNALDKAKFIRIFVICGKYEFWLVIIPSVNRSKTL